MKPCIIMKHFERLKRYDNGMSTLAIKFDDHAVDVSFTKTSLHFVLADGREISAPFGMVSTITRRNAG